MALWLPVSGLSAAEDKIASPAAKDPVVAKENTQAADAAAPPIAQGVASDYLVARFARQSGDFDSASEYLTRALQQDPENPDIIAQLLTLQVVKGEMTTALATASQLKGNNSADPLANLLLVIDTIKHENYTKAEERLSSSFDTATGQLWLPLVEAWVDVAQGKLKKPLTVEELPVSVGRASSIIQYHLALINAKAGFTDEAAKDFLASVEDPEHPAERIMESLVQFYEKNGKPAILTDHVNSYLGTARGKQHVMESAVATPIDGVAEVLFTMGDVMQAAGIVNDAALYFQLARYLRPDFYLATYSLAEVLASANHHRASSAMLASIPQASRFYSRARLQQAVNLGQQDKNDEALKILATLAGEKTSAPEPWAARGDILRKQKRYLEATIAYSEAIKRGGGNKAEFWPVYFSRGACFDELGRWSDAKSDFNKALELKPDQPDVLNYLGYSLLVRGEKIEAAKGMLEKALSQRPQDPHIIDSMGWALYLLGEYENALPYLERAAELMPGDVTVNDHLGDVYWRLDRKQEARFQWERALTFKPGDKEASAIQKKIAGGMAPAEKRAGKTASAQPKVTTQ